MRIAYSAPPAPPLANTRFSEAAKNQIFADFRASPARLGRNRGHLRAFSRRLGKFRVRSGDFETSDHQNYRGFRQNASRFSSNASRLRFGLHYPIFGRLHFASFSAPFAFETGQRRLEISFAILPRNRLHDAPNRTHDAPNRTPPSSHAANLGLCKRNRQKTLFFSILFVTLRQISGFGGFRMPLCVPKHPLATLRQPPARSAKWRNRTPRRTKKRKLS